MGANSKIEWCDHTFNPWIGCQRVSAGCDFCYAESWAKRSGLVQWGPGAERRRTSDENWFKPRQWNRAAQATGVRAKVFCASLADWLDNAVPEDWRMDLIALIRETPHLDWLLLTKRIENYARLVPWVAPPANVWLGVTCEDRVHYEKRWVLLRQIPASIRFISYEPALGPLSFFPFPHLLAGDAGPRFPDWVICGGESGSNARPMHPDWARSLRDQCAAAGVPFLFKQWGEWAPGECADKPQTRTERVADWFGDRWDFSSLTPRVSQETHEDDAPDLYWLGKKAAGRLLDGVEHSAFPELAR